MSMIYSLMIIWNIFFIVKTTFSLNDGYFIEMIVFELLKIRLFYVYDDFEHIIPYL
jgi:hypothetical protein